MIYGDVLFGEFGSLLSFVTFKLEQVLEEGKAIKVVNQGLKILVHRDILYHHGEVVLIGCQGEGQSKISDNEFSKLSVLHNEPVYDELVAHFVKTIESRVTEPFYTNHML